MPKVEINRPEEDTIGNYIRVGTKYHKLIRKPDRFGIFHETLEPWTKEEIKTDFDHYAPKQVAKYDSFVLEPSNTEHRPIINNCYNMYSPFPHKPKQGDWPWTKVLLEHVFGEQYELALTYFKVLYERPKQILPVLGLVSKERNTGKSTFLNWMNIVFGNNMVQIEPDMVAKSSFNGAYAFANIIAVDETLIDNREATEKIKSLATKKFLRANLKHVNEFSIPFYGKLIIASNHENRFMKVDKEEIRYWVRKLSEPKIENHNIEEDLKSEIPAFLHYLTTLPPVDYSRSRMVFTPDELYNEALQAVKDESRVWLYKELKIRIEDWFNNNEKEKELKVSATDIKKEWYDNNHKATIDFIARIIREEFELESRLEYYFPYETGEKKRARCYTFKREDFCTDNIDNEADKPEDEHEAPF